MTDARRNFLAIYVSHLATAIGMSAFIPFLPFYLAELGVQDEGTRLIWAGLVFAGAPAMASVMGPIWGALGDRFGRKMMVLRSVASIAVFVGAMGFVTAAWQLLALRLVQGLFSGFVAAGNTLVSVSTPDERQGTVLGQLQTGLLFGLAIGPVFGGWVGDALGYRPVFFVTAGLAAIALVVVGLFAREIRDDEPPDRRGLARGVGADLRTTFASRPLRNLLGSLFLFRAALSLMLPILPVYLLDTFDLPKESAGLWSSWLFSAVAIAVLFFSASWGRRADRDGPGRTFVLCTTVAAVGFLLYGIATSALMLVGVRAAQGIFIAGILPAAYAAAARLAPRRQRGSSIALTQSSMQIAMAVGSTSGGALAAALGVDVVFWIAAGMFGIAAAQCQRGWRPATDPATEPASAPSP